MRILRIFILLILLAGLSLLVPKNARAQANVDTQCVGEALAEYMTRITRAKFDGLISDKIKIGSPIFNLTNPTEVAIFDAMRSSGADFNIVEGWLGNTYTTYSECGSGCGITPDNTALGHYVDNGWWNQRFGGNPQKPVFFTEFGELNTAYNEDKAIPVAQMQAEFNRLNEFPEINKVAYFDFFPWSGENPDFDYHLLSPEQYQQITGGSSKAGGHSAQPVGTGGAGAYATALKSYAPNAGVAVEILVGQQDVRMVADAVNIANSRGLTMILRVCTGDTCYYSNPQTLITFLQQLDPLLLPNADLWVASGPNEPATEQWGAPGCYGGVGGPFDVEPYVPCNETYASRGLNNGNEFHSLRPYPASPCDKTVYDEVKMCGQDLVIKETYRFTSDETGTSGATYTCQSTGPNGEKTCDIALERASVMTIAIDNARLPIMGDTEVVTNSTKEVVTSEPNKQWANLMNGYASWFLNGVTSRAEEKDELINTLDPNDPEDSSRIYEIINFSGPLRKLLPLNIQNGLYATNALGSAPPVLIQEGLRSQQQEDANDVRHNQYGVCAVQAILGGQLPVICYWHRRGDVTNYRITDIPALLFTGGGGGLINPFTWNLNPLYSFIPFSSTEDLAGKMFEPVPKEGGNATNVELIFEPNANRERTLYFAHMQEVSELSEVLQNTYRSKNVDATGNAPIDQFELQKATAYCDILDTKGGAGDRLYGNLEGNLEDRVAGSTQNNQTTISARLSYDASFTCNFGPESFDQAAYDTCIEPYGPTPTQVEIDFCTDQATTRSECVQEVIVPFRIETSTPKADEVWDRMVAGGMAIFKRMFPKIGSGTPVDFIKDIPASSSVSYSTTVEGTGGALESSQTLAGNPNKNQPGGSAKIFFPHIGSVQEYFLEGIQCALRPQGMCGNQNYSNDKVDEAEEQNTSCTPEVNIASLPAIDPNCTGSCAGYGFSQSPTMRTIFESAASAFDVPVSVLLGVFYNEGGLNQPWTEEAVLQASGPNCQVSNCSSNVSGSGARGPWQFVASSWASAGSAVIEAGVSDGRTPNICNLLDSTFAAAKLLSIGKFGDPAYPNSGPGSQCFGVSYNQGSPSGSGCNWTPSDAMTSARQYLGYCQQPGHPDSNLPYYRACAGGINTCYQRSVMDFCPAIQ